ncbi:Protein zds1 [Ceratocystis fimbriata CBS 114723]|uniref:Protein zds1 n=1 Tax=Ceratocystis fimbriata CBS 114723 TaxID=1035309 RepID=A0A2C5XA83_9PEZI|nr:Protein zds1 [Ceratocystis fimbriata CBS 114723]
MQTSSHFYNDVGGNFNRRGPRGHGSQLSISDPSHHVTEAISTLYGSEDEDSPTPDGLRPLSFMPSALDELHRRSPLAIPDNDDSRKSVMESTSPSSKKPSRLSPGLTTSTSAGNIMSPTSPSISLKDVRNGNNFDNANDIAQELSNLQALRRMSMDVSNSSDPDMLPYNGMSLVAMPSIAPTGDDDEGDPSRLLWVPARVHPELAPGEFKTFIEDRVRSIKRRSSDSSTSFDTNPGSPSLGSPSLSSPGSLQRRKSMLSRQVDSSASSVHSLEDIESMPRERSYSGSIPLDELVNDAPNALRKLSMDAEPTDGDPDDKPVLAKGPGRKGLKRSTRTQYRKGGSVRGDRSGLSKRIAAARQYDESGHPIHSEDVPPVPTITRSSTEPILVPDNFSRPNRPLRRQPNLNEDSIGPNDTIQEEEDAPLPTDQEIQSSRSPSALDPSHPPVPQIVATPADDNQGVKSAESMSPKTSMEQPHHPQQQQLHHSQQQQQQQQHQQQQQQQHIPTSQSPVSPPTKEPKPSKWASLRNPQSRQPQQQAQPQRPPPRDDQHQHQNQQQQQQQQQQQSQIPHTPKQAHRSPGHPTGVGFVSTPNVEEQRKPEKLDKKSKKDKDDDTTSMSSTRSAGWKWFKSGSDEKEKKKKDEESKRHRSKQSASEKAHDNVRLDVLQTSIDGGHSRSNSRESAVLDRDNPENKPLEDKKHYRVKSDTKKDGIFSSIFGGSKKKGDRESGGNKKGHHLKVSEEIIFKPLRPDVDYPWTRFPLIEERAIYRMAHIKLAHPRRPLHSQVLLSNFMYNYLAIVQAMNPTMQVPLSPQQRRLEEERRRKEQEQQYLAEQQMREQQEQQQQHPHPDEQDINGYPYDYDQHAENEYLDDAAAEYLNDGYEYDHGDQRDQRQQKPQHNNEHQHQPQQQQQQQHHKQADSGGGGGNRYYNQKDYYHNQQQQDWQDQRGNGDYHQNGGKGQQGQMW